MQDAVKLNPEDIIQHAALTENEEDATYHIQAIVTAKDNPIKGENLQAIMEESRNTGKPLANLFDRYLGDSAEVETVITPIDTIPNIAKRTERKRR